MKFWPEAKPRRVIIAHGWNDAPGSGWLGWLARELEARGFEVVAPAFPMTHTPNTRRWVEELAATGQLDENTVLVAHSLGVPTTLRFLNDYPQEIRIAGLVLVAGFGDPGVKLPIHLLRTPFDFERLRRRARNRICIYSNNDLVVTPKWTQRLATNLAARELIVLGAGHFNGLNWVPGRLAQLPAALDAVLSCYSGPWDRWLDRIKLSGSRYLVRTPSE